MPLPVRVVTVVTVPDDSTTAPVLQAVTLPSRVESVDSVAAPVGRLTVPEMFVMFQVPACVACTANVPALVTTL